MKNNHLFYQLSVSCLVLLILIGFPAETYAAGNFTAFKNCIIDKLISMLDIGVIILLISIIWEKLTGEVVVLSIGGEAAAAGAAGAGEAGAAAAAAEAAGGRTLTKVLKKIAEFVGKKLIPIVGIALLLGWLLYMLVDCLPHLAGYNGIGDLIDQLLDGN
tara:strand:+ start:4780 stop:5259 length:480 start_codon:yes stop_codon:yes gene_type:complete